MENLPAISAETTALMSMIERVCVDKDADLAKLEKMIDMQERILDRNAKQAFAADFAAMQIELPRISENGRGHNSSKYALLEDINDKTRPVLNKYGFGVSFSLDQTDSKVIVKAKLSHRLGHYEETCLSLPLDTSGNKNGVQAAGSTISYGKRYAICALLNISTGDDADGHQEQQAPQKTPINDATLEFAIEEITGRRAELSKLLNFHEFTPAQKQRIKQAFPQVQL